MSTLPQRLENRCLNCDALTHGRYCQVCGQENVIHKMTFFGMIKHFVFDLLHFDGKFFTTLATLFSKPGKVPFNFISGKRMQYLEPFRMYIFTSTVFFLLYFTFFQNGNNGFFKLDIRDNNVSVDTGKSNSRKISIGRNFEISEAQLIKAKSFDEVSEIYSTMNNGEKMGFIEKAIAKKVFYYRKTYPNDKDLAQTIGNDVLHKVPQLIFLIMPFFVGLLRLLYIRNKNLLYSDHGIFTLYMFSSTFIFIFCYNVISKFLLQYIPTNISAVVGVLFFVGYNVYFFLAMLFFYKQSIGKTLTKFIGLLVLNAFVSLICMTIFMLVSIIFL